MKSETTQRIELEAKFLKEKITRAVDLLCETEAISQKSADQKTRKEEHEETVSIQDKLMGLIKTTSEVIEELLYG